MTCLTTWSSDRKISYLLRILWNRSQLDPIQQVWSLTLQVFSPYEAKKLDKITTSGLSMNYQELMSEVKAQEHQRSQLKLTVLDLTKTRATLDLKHLTHLQQSSRKSNRLSVAKIKRRIHMISIEKSIFQIVWARSQRLFSQHSQVQKIVHSLTLLTIIRLWQIV